MNFYENICDQQLYNHVYLLFYMAGYVGFMKTSDELPFLYLTSNDITYPTINNLLSDNILLSLFNIKYQLEAIYYILSITLNKYFKKTMYY